MRRVATVVLVCGDAEVASWPLAGWDCPGLAVVDELARLQVAARRLGYSIRLRDAGTELCELLDLVGLGEVRAVPAGYAGSRAGRPKAAKRSVSRKL
ncbi:MAG: hypothetical protein DLM61_20970 [Pseudonocardiales bacterium]|nr:MAG: hypothetical protein DLM61_20970 [Pseudonocardiales bacterium]